MLLVRILIIGYRVEEKGRSFGAGLCACSQNAAFELEIPDVQHETKGEFAYAQLEGPESERRTMSSWVPDLVEALCTNSSFLSSKEDGSLFQQTTKHDKILCTPKICLLQKYRTSIFLETY